MVTFTGVEDGAVDKNIPEKQSREAEIGEMHVVGKRASNIDPNNQRSTAKRKGVISPRSPKNAAKPWQLLLHSCVEVARVQRCIAVCHTLRADGEL